MMNLKLDTDPMPGHQGAKILAGTHHELSAPKPTIKPTNASPPDAPAGTRLFMRLPANACDVPGCKKYGFAFSSPQALLEHKRAVHFRNHAPKHDEPAPAAAPESAPAKKYQCKLCPESFERVWELSAHCRRTHPKPQPKPKAAAPLSDPAMFQCPLCPQQGSRTWLSAHFSRTHKGEILDIPSDKFFCGVCGASGTTRDNLEQHIRRTHPTFSSAMIRKREETPEQPRQARATQPSAPRETQPTLAPRGNFFLRLTGTKAECGSAALLLIQNGYNHLTTGQIE